MPFQMRAREGDPLTSRGGADGFDLFLSSDSFSLFRFMAIRFRTPQIQTNPHAFHRNMKTATNVAMHIVIDVTEKYKVYVPREVEPKENSLG